MNQGINLGDHLTIFDGANEVKVSAKYTDFGFVVNLIVSNLFVIAGILIFFLVIGAGLSYLKDTDKGKDEAKNLITGAVIGFLVMFSAYWIVQIVKLLTGAEILI